MRSSRLLTIVASLLVFAACLPAFSQKYTIAKVVIHGGAPYTDEELSAAAGLKPGDTLTNDTLADPAQRLLDTGLFDSAAMQFNGHDAVFDLKPTPLAGLIPVSLDNFAWWTPDDLAAELHKRLPLYRGVCSNSGNFADSIQTALQQMLTEKNVTAKLEHRFIEPSAAQPMQLAHFFVFSPQIYLHHISLTGVPDDADTEVFKKMMHDREGKSFNDGLASYALENALLSSALEHGYILAKLTAVTLSIAPQGGDYAVDYAAQLVPGNVYKLSAVAVAPQAAVPDAQITPLLKLHAGDLANGILMSKQEGDIEKLFLAQGYLYASAQHTLTPDTAAHMAAYTLTMTPGDQYRLRNMVVRGLSPAAQQEFSTEWKMKTGDLYDSTYFEAFLKRTVAQEHTPLWNRGVTYDAQPDAQAHMVDLTITYP